MRRRARAGIVALALALTALSSCGASGTSTVERAKPGGRGVALKRIGNFAEPVYVTGAPADQAPLRGRAAGRVVVLRNGQPAGRPFLDISADSSATAASAACSRSPSRPTTARAAASTSITPTTRQHPVDEFHAPHATAAARARAAR
jgi:hypothetical protein